MAGHTFQINFRLLLLRRFVFDAEIWNLNFAFYNFQTVRIGDLLASAFVFRGREVLNLRDLAIDTLFQFTIEYNLLWSTA